MAAECKDVKLRLVGGCRGDEDEARVAKLKELAKELDIEVCAGGGSIACDVRHSHPLCVQCVSMTAGWRGVLDQCSFQ